MPVGRLTAVFVLGITGGIGTGKSTSAEILARLGWPVADADAIAREVVQPGEPAWTELRQTFGEALFRPDGTLDRQCMAEHVFAEPDARARLEAILHPRIRAEWQRRVAGWRGEGRELGVVVIPLLYETQAEGLLDAVVCVACSPSTQRARLRARGWSEPHVAQRLAAQWPLEAKIERADFVVWTEPPVPVHERQLRCVLRRLGLSWCIPRGS